MRQTAVDQIELAYGNVRTRSGIHFDVILVSVRCGVTCGRADPRCQFDSHGSDDWSGACRLVADPTIAWRSLNETRKCASGFEWRRAWRETGNEWASVCRESRSEVYRTLSQGWLGSSCFTSIRRVRPCSLESRCECYSDRTGKLGAVFAHEAARRTNRCEEWRNQFAMRRMDPG